MCKTEKRKNSANFLSQSREKLIYIQILLKEAYHMIRKVLKKILCVAMCLIMCGSTAAMALTVDSPDTKIVEPAYENISANSCSLKISGVNSVSSAVLHAKGSMYLHIKMELQKKKSGIYQTIETWTASRTGMVLTMEEERLINVLASYRLKVTFTAGSETVVYYDYP